MTRTLHEPRWMKASFRYTLRPQNSPGTTDTMETADSAAYVAAAAAAQLLLQLVGPLLLLPHVLLLLLQLLPPPLPPLVPLLQQMRLLLPRSWHRGPEQGDCRCCYSRHPNRHGNRHQCRSGWWHEQTFVVQPTMPNLHVLHAVHRCAHTTVWPD